MNDECSIRRAALPCLGCPEHPNGYDPAVGQQVHPDDMYSDHPPFECDEPVKVIKEVELHDIGVVSDPLPGQEFTITESLDEVAEEAVQKTILSQGAKEFALGFLTSNVQVEEKKIERRGFHYSKRTYVNDSGGISRTLETPVFSFYSWRGNGYPSLSVTLGHRWLNLSFLYDHKTQVRVSATAWLINPELNVWWPGA